ncbi:hypothetical protein SDC9_80261 [bioreactor metagenome]|uniref:Uncharacterized protein n=1 Tax=bioreactor metagenome TaxID=1076179 RepID=A0A644Z4P8_9ZZZZ
MSHSVIIHRNGVGIERVGFDNIGSGSQVAAMNLFNNFRLRDRKQIVVPFLQLRCIFKPFATILLFRKFVALYHCPHCTVENEDAGV